MWIDRQDLLYTIRSARREPLLSIIAVVALSLGVGLNAGVFTLLNAMFLNDADPDNTPLDRLRREPSGQQRPLIPEAVGKQAEVREWAPGP